jgi:hypothetical protein
MFFQRLNFKYQFTAGLSNLLLTFIIILVLIIIIITTTTTAAALRHHVNNDYGKEIVVTRREVCVRVAGEVIRLFAPASLVGHIASPE